mmetsp:Transcript_25059/g.30842  ORF Transcript_25059/g.30842 Transcript_25059/m.30842 type:complete len:211 (+) Transcript_25059:488-1120(+)
MINQLSLNGSWSNIFSLRCFENLFRAASDLQPTFLIDFTTVTSANVSISCYCLCCCFWIFVVSHHSSCTLDLNFSIFYDANVYSIISLTNVANTTLSRPAKMRVIKVFCHTITLKKFKTKRMIPRNQISRDGCGPRTGDTNFVKPKPFQNLLLHENVNDGDFQQHRQLLWWHFSEYSLLEFGPKSRNRYEECRLSSVEISNKSRQCFRKK